MPSTARRSTTASNPRQGDVQFEDDVIEGENRGIPGTVSCFGKLPRISTLARDGVARLSAFPVEKIACDLPACLFYERSSVTRPLELKDGRIVLPNRKGFGVEPLP